MNVNEETAALIAEAREWANGHPNRRSGELMRELADALAAVPDAATEAQRVSESDLADLIHSTSVQNFGGLEPRVAPLIARAVLAALDGAPEPEEKP